MDEKQQQRLMDVLITLGDLVDKQVEAMNAQSALLDRVVRGQTMIVEQMRTLAAALAAHDPVH